MSTEIRTVTANEREMRYIRFGNESGEPLVILPGLSLRSVMNFADSIQTQYSAVLAREYEIFLFDRVTVFPKDYDEYQMAEDTLEALRKTGIEKAAVMGVSQGGMIAQVMAAGSPETIQGLILCSSAPSTRGCDPKMLAEWKKYAEERNAEALMESFAGYVYTPSFFHRYRDAIIALGKGATEQEFLNFLSSLRSLPAFDMTDRLNRIACPAFVLGAGKDRVLGVQGSLDLMAALHCEGYIYEENGHGVFDEAPDYQDRILAFLKNR